ncbi:hypothetical protein L484_000862 [Morus notabilis]|uniref:Uncharacterized protein n=1 Tax=Morus notabilis TaxID=981085 RepID=W9SDF0_9ROSA|nr:hypothetical protein L484_000862 [Morus notabilis]
MGLLSEGNRRWGDLLKVGRSRGGSGLAVMQVRRVYMWWWWWCECDSDGLWGRGFGGGSDKVRLRQTQTLSPSLARPTNSFLQLRRSFDSICRCSFPRTGQTTNSSPKRGPKFALSRRRRFTLHHTGSIALDFIKCNLIDDEEVKTECLQMVDRFGVQMGFVFWFVSRNKDS